jgi:uncharacterized protein (TIGR02246 family)
MTNAPVVEELAAIEQRLARAWVEGDQATIRSMLADDWVTTDVTGTVRAKDAVLRDMFAATPTPIAAMAIDDVRVRVFGDVAVVTGRTTASGTGGGQIQLRFTDVLARRDGRWLFVASQGTAIA